MFLYLQYFCHFLNGCWPGSTISVLCFGGMSRHAAFHLQQHSISPSWRDGHHPQQREQSCVWVETSPVTQDQLVLWKKWVSMCVLKALLSIIHDSLVKTLFYQQWLKSIHTFVFWFLKIYKRQDNCRVLKDTHRHILKWVYFPKLTLKMIFWNEGNFH